MLIVLVPVLFLSSLMLANPISAQAEDIITFKVEPEEYYAWKKGEIFTVNITIDNVNASQRLVGVQFRLGYNDTLLEVVNVAEGSFMKDPRWNLYGTFCTYYIEPESKRPNGTIIAPPHVSVGVVLLPNASGVYQNFPYGDGTLATMTFKAVYQPVEPLSPANCTLELFQILDQPLAINDSKEGLPVETVDGYYEIVSALYPISTYTYEPLRPVAGQEVTFDASGCYDPDGSIIWYYWEFEDGTTMNATYPIVTHVFNASGSHTVNLLVKDIDNLTSTITKIVEVGAPAPIEVRIDAGSLYFRGEICEYNILITHLGRAVNVDELSATLYFEGDVPENLTGLVEIVETGFYRIPYTIPGTAEAGTYTLLVEAKYNGMNGMKIKSFDISENLAGMKDTVDSIHNDILTVVIPDLGVIKLNLTEINATITSIDGTTVTISTDVGDLTSDLSDLSDSILSLDGKIDDATGTQGTILTTLYATLILAIIAVVAAAIAAYFARKP